MTLKANVDITFNNLLVCKGFKIIDTGSGPFVSKPSVKGSDNNIKITTPFDLAVAQAIIANSN